MPNPYASTGSVATVTSSIAGGADDLTGGGPGSAPKLSTGTVLARLAAYVRPHAGLFVLSFISAAVSVILQLYVPIQIGRAIDIIIGPGQVDFEALLVLAMQLAATELIFVTTRLFMMLPTMLRKVWKDCSLPNSKKRFWAMPRLEKSTTSPA